MLKLGYVFPEGGYLYYPEEQAKVIVTIENCSETDEKIEVVLRVTDYYGKEVENRVVRAAVAAGATEQVDLVLDNQKLGYFCFEYDVRYSGGKITKRIGLGRTTRHERSLPAVDSHFGMSCNRYVPEQHIAHYAKMGIRHLRVGPTDPIRYEELFRKYGMLAQIQMQGSDIYKHFFNQGGGRYARPNQNAAYYYQKEWGDLAPVQEHGNEHWEERNLALLGEWVKTSGYARLTADRAGWYAGSGCPGVDVHKLKILYDQGMFDYTTFVAIHAYSFPGIPEQPRSYWSTARLEDLAAWMKEKGISMPVACTEQGYPAMYDQTESEVYSMEDMASLTAQGECLVRSWLIFLSYGVAQVIPYNGPYGDGFGMTEQEGPAPWPASMAVAQLIREVDGAEYIGDYQKDEGVYFKVFRQKSGKLVGIVWRPIYYSRSCDKSLNLALDLSGYESEGKTKELYDYTLHHLAEGYAVKDIMGNPVKTEGVVQIGESPLYIEGLSEDIVSELKDLTIFPCKTVQAKEMPCPVILGLNDAWPAPEAYITSRFMPGQSREYKIRVHNYSSETLKDTMVLTYPDAFILSEDHIEVEVPAGVDWEGSVWVTAKHVAQCGDYKIHAKLEHSEAHPVYQIAEISSPLHFNPLKKVLKAGDEIELVIANGSNETQEYTLHIAHEEIRFRPEEVTVRVPANTEAAVALQIESCPATYEPVFTVKATSGELHAEYHTVLPIHYIERTEKTELSALKEKQQSILTGYDLFMTAGINYTGSSLIGLAEPAPMLVYARPEMDKENLSIHFEIHDSDVVCIKNCRRDNVDSDGVWIRLYKTMEDEAPYRQFCIMPADQAGRTEGASIKECAKQIHFAKPYTDYDFKECEIHSEIFEDRYTIDAKFTLKSLGLEDAKEVIMDLRVVNMDEDDWSKFYDTGKIRYSVG